MAAVRADISRFMNTARVRLPGATDDAMQLELFMVMDEFFRGSNLWQEDVRFDVVGTDAPGTVYEVTPTGPATVDKLLWMYSLPEGNSLRGFEIRGTMSTPGEIVLATQPSDDKTYVATLALTVADPTLRNGYVVFPEWVLAKYRAVLLDGLLGKMMSQPNKPFTNSQLSVYHLRRFLSGIAQARIDVQRNNVYRNQAWRFPRRIGSQRGGSGGYFPPQ